MKTKITKFEALACIAVGLTLGTVAGLVKAQQRPINVGPAAQSFPNANPFAGMPRPSGGVTDHPDTTLTITIPAAFATALEKDRVDTLLPTIGADGKTITMQPLNPDMGRHLMYLMLQDSGPLIQVFRKYPPAAAQVSIDAANSAAKSVQDQITAARNANAPQTIKPAESAPAVPAKK